ncbi:cyclic lactone autoinducer peptide [Lysinibacillus capsici]|nr:cyclic lactone autoinducer peptide [Lysinibacillus sp. YS11]
MIKIITYIIGIISLFFNSITTVSSCFWFSYEPELPDEQE